MTSISLDIFRKDAQGNPIVGSHDARHGGRTVNRLASALRRPYFVFDQRTRQVVASVDRFDGDRRRQSAL
jgi:hypothetical protein